MAARNIIGKNKSVSATNAANRYYHCARPAPFETLALRICMITEKISELAIKILDSAGYTGAGVLMCLESMIAPVPSEAVMPFVGFQVADGHWNLWVAILVTSVGSISGSLLSYGLGYF